jgi:hypothetical protein
MKIQEKNYLVADVCDREISLIARDGPKTPIVCVVQFLGSLCPNTTRSTERIAGIDWKQRTNHVLEDR